MIFFTASAPMPASKRRPCRSLRLRYSDSVRVCMTLIASIACRSPRAQRRASSVSRATCSRSLASASSIPPVRSAIAVACFSFAPARPAFASLSTALTSALATSRSFASASFDVLPARAITSPVAAKTTSSAISLPPALMAVSSSLRGGRQLLGAGRLLLLDARLLGAEGGLDLLLLVGDRGLELGALLVDDGLGARDRAPSAPRRRAGRRRSRSCSSTRFTT